MVKKPVKKQRKEPSGLAGIANAAASTENVKTVFARSPYHRNQVDELDKDMDVFHKPFKVKH